MGIHQVLVGASPGDAITNTARRLREVLRKAVDSEIYAHHVHADLVGDIHRIEPQLLVDGDPAGLLIYHASIGDDLVTDFVLHRREQLALMYHNITPAHFFEKHDQRFADLLGGGRRDLRTLQPHVVAAVADSEFNADELRQLGYTDVAVIPVVFTSDRLANVAADAERVAALHDQPGRTVLYVGQVLPHKRPDFLLRSAYVLATYLDPSVNIHLVGASRLSPYSDEINQLVRSLEIPNITMWGEVTDAQLVAHYEHSDVFATASEHEGFCVPLLEAMQYRLPVVARRFAAIPDTAADAALLVDPADDEFVFAEALALLCRDDGLRTDLVRRGDERLAAFDSDRDVADFVRWVASV